MNGCIPNDDLKWNQNKINVIWKKCEEFYEDYGVQVDPRLLLAIIVEEGTGSFIHYKEMELMNAIKLPNRNRIVRYSELENLISTD